MTKLTPNLEVFWSDIPNNRKLSKKREEIEGAKRWEFEGD